MNMTWGTDKRENEKNSGEHRRRGLIQSIRLRQFDAFLLPTTVDIHGGPIIGPCLSLLVFVVAVAKASLTRLRIAVQIPYVEITYGFTLHSHTEWFEN